MRRAKDREYDLLRRRCATGDKGHSRRAKLDPAHPQSQRPRRGWLRAFLGSFRGAPPLAPAPHNGLCGLYRPRVGASRHVETRRAFLWLTTTRSLSRRSAVASSFTGYTSRKRKRSIRYAGRSAIAHRTSSCSTSGCPTATGLTWFGGSARNGRHQSWCSRHGSARDRRSRH